MTRAVHVSASAPAAVALAELSLAPGETRSLALPAQSYSVRKRVDGGFLVGDVNLTWGGEERLDEAALRFVPFAAVAGKGAPAADWNDLAASFWVRDGVVPGNDWLLGGAVAYRRRLGPAFVLGAELACGDGSTRTADGAVATRGVEAVLEAARLHEAGRVHWRLGGALGGSVFWQALPGASARATGGFLAGLAAGFTWVVADPLLLVAGLRGGLELQREEGEHRAGAPGGGSHRSPLSPGHRCTAQYVGTQAAHPDRRMSSGPRRRG